MSDSVERILFSVFAGVLGGLLMAILLLWLMIANSFVISNAQFVLIVLIAFAAPMCMNFLREKGFNVILAQIVMVALSFLITVLYARSVGMASNLAGKYSGFFSSVFNATLILHGAAVIGIIVPVTGRKIRKK